MVGDWVSSMLSRGIPGVREGNDFAVDANGGFVLHKMMIVDGLALFGLLACAITTYQACKNWSREVGRVLMCIPIIYIAYDRMLSAVIPNWCYVLRLHIVDNTAPISQILRVLLNRGH
jgi:hypothetical protein